MKSDFDPDAGDYRALASSPEAARSVRRASRFPPPGVTVSQSLGGEVWSRITTRHRGRKVTTEKVAVTGGLLGVGLGLLALYEADKVVSGWLGSIGADLSAVNPMNWLASGFNAAAAQARALYGGSASPGGGDSNTSSGASGGSVNSATCGCSFADLLGGSYCGSACLGFSPTL